MRLKYYKLTLRQMKIKKAFVFFFSVIIIVNAFIYFFNKRVEPTLDAICSNNARNVAFKTSTDAVNEYIKNVKYDDLIYIDKNADGKVVSLNANVSQINMLSNTVSMNIQNKLEQNNEANLTLPLSEIFGIRAIGAKGPKIKVWTLVEGNVSVDFKSSFEEAGINQTKHTLYVEVTTNVETIAPLFSDEKQYVNKIMIAETVIVSDVPATYYQINGIDELDTKSTLDLVGQ